MTTKQREQLIQDGFKFEKCDHGFEEFQDRYSDVWDTIQDEISAGKLFWDDKKSGFWLATSPTNPVHVLMCVGIVAACAWMAWKHLPDLFKPKDQEAA